MEPPTTPRIFFIAGVQHRPTWERTRDRFSRCAEPTTLRVELVGEPSNSFDRYAVKVIVDDAHVGYVPRTFSSDFWALHSLGYKAVATLSAFNPSAQPWQMYEVSVTFKEKTK